MEKAIAKREFFSAYGNFGKFSPKNAGKSRCCFFPRFQQGKEPQRGFISLLVIELVTLVLRVAGDVHLQAAENVAVHLGQNDGGVRLAARQQGKLLHGQRGGFVGGGADGQSHQHLVAVKTGVVIAQIIAFQGAQRADDGG